MDTVPLKGKKFQFKAFDLEWNDAVFPLTTDSLLLGAWTPLEESTRDILDVGSGSGVLALMLAQRCSESDIRAIDTSSDSVECAGKNFRRSPWNDRLSVERASVFNGDENDDQRFGLVISNPPYFTGDLKSSSFHKSRNRHWAVNVWSHFFASVRDVLKDDGKLSLIFPYSVREEITKCAISQGLYPGEILNIRPKPDKPIKRIACLFSMKDITPKHTGISIMRSNTGSYSEAFITLTESFYLTVAKE